MKILLVVHKYPPFSVGGTEVYTRNLALELTHRGHDVLLYFRADLDNQPFLARDESIESVRARRVSAPLVGGQEFPLVEFARTFLNSAIERDFSAFLAQEQPDIVHFQHVMELSARLIPIARRMGCPVVLTLHDYWFLCTISQLVWPDAQVCRGKALGLNCARCVLAARLHSAPLQILRPLVAPLLQVRDRAVRKAALQADRMIAPSHFLIEQYVHAGFPPDRFVYLENGLDVRRIQRYARQPSPDGRMRVTFLGSLAWQKGVHVLVEAFCEVPLEKAVLRVYGDPTRFPDYSARLEHMANSDNTSFEGLVANEEVGRVLAETDLLVVPSLWYENSPVVIQEALAAGVPIIASDLGALPEKVGSAGWLFPAGDVSSLRDLLLRVISRGTRDKVRSSNSAPMDIAEACAQLVEIYRDVRLVSGPQRPELD